MNESISRRSAVLFGFVTLATLTGCFFRREDHDDHEGHERHDEHRDEGRRDDRYMLHSGKAEADKQPALPAEASAPTASKETSGIR
jgi:hypothetical protein